MHRRTLIATAIAAALVGSPAAAAAGRPSRPDKVDWTKIQTAAHLRTTALAPRRTARFRAFAASLGLRELASIHPLARGRCLTAVIDLQNNLLDLENAYPGERWGPLRRAVAREPSVRACAPAKRGRPQRSPAA